MLDKEEAAVYDRQIRLWGVTAQNKLKKSKILILGFTGLASEVVKTLVLAGVHSITIVDNSPLQPSDPYSNLFCRPDGTTNDQRTATTANKLNLLNPLVKIHIDNTDFTQLPASYFKDFDLVSLHSFATKNNISKINNICRSLNIKFYLAIDFGFFGAAFSDLGDSFTYSIEEKNNSVDDKTLSDEENNDDDEDDDEDERPAKRPRLEEVINSSVVEKKLEFVPFETMLSQVENHKNPVLRMLHIILEFYSKLGREPTAEDINLLKELKFADTVSILDWAENIYGSLSPVCAIIGGVIGQDMIRTLSGRDAPICNLFLFDGINMDGVIEKVGPRIAKQKVVEHIDEIVL